MTKTAQYEICDYGIENAQYFQGHGTSFTNYQYSVLGCGDTYSEALADALEGCSEHDVILSPEDAPLLSVGKGPSASAQHEQYCDAEDHSECESELYYYVGLRWN